MSTENQGRNASFRKTTAKLVIEDAERKICLLKKLTGVFTSKKKKQKKE